FKERALHEGGVGICRKAWQEPDHRSAQRGLWQDTIENGSRFIEVARDIHFQRRMVMQRGEIWWASLPPPTKSGPGYRRPVLVIQSDEFNTSAINTTVVVSITSNIRLARAPGNVLCRKHQSKLSKNSVIVINVSQVATVDKTLLT